MAGYAQGNILGVYGFMSSPVHSQPRQFQRGSVGCQSQDSEQPCLGSGSIFGTELPDATDEYTNAKHNKNAVSSCFACLSLGSKPYAQPSDSVDGDELPTPGCHTMMKGPASESGLDSSFASKLDTFSGSVDQGTCHVLAVCNHDSVGNLAVLLSQIGEKCNPARITRTEVKPKLPHNHCLTHIPYSLHR